MNHFFPPRQPPAPRPARGGMPAIVPQNVLRALIGQSKKRCAAYAEMVEKLDAGMAELRFEAERLAQSGGPDEATANAAREYFDAILRAFVQNRQHLEAQAHYELRLQDTLGRWLAASAPMPPPNVNAQVPRGFRRAPPTQRPAAMPMQRPAAMPAAAAQSPFAPRVAERPVARSAPRPAGAMPSAFAPYFARAAAPPAAAAAEPAPVADPEARPRSPWTRSASTAEDSRSNGSAHAAAEEAPPQAPAQVQSDDDSAS